MRIAVHANTQVITLTAETQSEVFAIGRISGKLDGVTVYAPRDDKPTAEISIPFKEFIEALAR